MEEPNNAAPSGKGRKKGRKTPSKRKMQTMKESLEQILYRTAAEGEPAPILEAEGLDSTYQNTMCLALIRKAMGGDIKAFEVIRDTLGQKPGQKEQEITGEIKIIMEKEAEEYAG